jgi:hypothetical protein
MMTLPEATPPSVLLVVEKLHAEHLAFDRRTKNLSNFAKDTLT